MAILSCWPYGNKAGAAQHVGLRRACMHLLPHVVEMLHCRMLLGPGWIASIVHLARVSRQKGIEAASRELAVATMIAYALA